MVLLEFIIATLSNLTNNSKIMTRSATAMVKLTENMEAIKEMKEEIFVKIDDMKTDMKAMLEEEKKRKRDVDTDFYAVKNRDARVHRIQFAKERVACHYSFKYGIKEVHPNEIQVDANGPSETILVSDTLVQEILRYFEQGLKYLLPENHFIYSAVRDEEKSGKITSYKKKDRPGAFKRNLLKHLSHVLAEEVGIEEASDNKTYVYCL